MKSMKRLYIILIVLFSSMLLLLGSCTQKNVVIGVAMLQRSLAREGE